MQIFPQHSCGDSRLSCVECETQVCPKCMVQCPVGNRCKKCAAKTESHVLRVTPAVATRTFVASAFAGYGFAYVSPFLGGWFYSWIIVYFLGALIGNVLHKVASYKMGTAIVSIVVGGLIVGSVLNPQTFGFDNRGIDDEKVAAAMVAAEIEETEMASGKRAKFFDEFDDDRKFSDQAKNDGGTKTDSDSEAKSEEKAEAKAASQRKTARRREITERMVKEQLEQLKSHRQSSQFWHFVKMLIFAIGILTPFTGIMPQFPFFPYRR